MLTKFKKALLSNQFLPFIENDLGQLSEEAYATFIADLKEEDLHLLFYACVTEADRISLLPSAIAHSLKKDYKFEKAYQLFHFLGIKKIVATVDRPILFFKGIFLNHFIKKDLYKRSCDIDILIHHQEEAVVVKQLESIGYQRKNRMVPYAEFPMSKGPNLLLDVHYNINSSSPFAKVFQFNSEDFFADSQTIDIGEVALMTFSMELSFIHLCLHYTINHKLDAFLHLYEIGEFLRYNASALQTAELIRLAEKHQVAGIIYLVLRLLRSYDEATSSSLYRAFSALPSVDVQKIDAFVEKNKVTERVVDNSLLITQFALSSIVLNSLPKVIKALYGYLFISVRKIYLVLIGEWTLSYLMNNMLTFFQNQKTMWSGQK